jgi:hypothetical protein
MKKPNISIIVLDTLRLDEFKRLERERGAFGKLGFTFIDNCIAPASWTLPSHASLFTGLYPSEHGAHETTKIKSLDIDLIKLKMRTFISDLSDMGYKTYCISSNPYVHPVYGFNEFDEFKEESYFTDVFGSTIEIPGRLKPLIAKYRQQYGNSFFKIGFAMLRDDPMLITETLYLPLTGALTMKSLAKKLKAKLIEGWPIEKGGKRIVETVEGMRLKAPYFLFINMMEAHDPYVGKKDQDFTWSTTFLKKGPSKQRIELWKKLYKKASLKAYRYALKVMTTLQERYGDEQIMILTSDHGQAFNEHGFIGHGAILYDEVAKVPLAIKLPKSCAGHGMHDTHGYSSLVNIRGFLFDVLEGKSDAFSNFHNKEVYMESFGIPANITMVPGIDKARLRAYEKYKKRTFS